MKKSAILSLVLVATASCVKSCEIERARENAREKSQANPELEVLGYELRYPNLMKGDPRPSDEMLVAGEVRNNTDIRLKYVRITFNIYDDQGAIIDNLTASINDLDPHRTWKFWTNHERNYRAATAKLADLRAYR